MRLKLLVSTKTSQLAGATADEEAQTPQAALLGVRREPRWPQWIGYLMLLVGYLKWCRIHVIHRSRLGWIGFFQPLSPVGLWVVSSIHLIGIEISAVDCVHRFGQMAR